MVAKRNIRKPFVCSPASTGVDLMETKVYLKGAAGGLEAGVTVTTSQPSSILELN